MTELELFQCAFGAQARKLRQQKHLTAKQVATNDGIFTSPYLSNLENGRINATLDVVRRLSLATGVPAKEFFNFR